MKFKTFVIESCQDTNNMNRKQGNYEWSGVHELYVYKYRSLCITLSKKLYIFINCLTKQQQKYCFSI